MKNIKLFFLLFLLTVAANAQPPFPGDVDDVDPPASVDDLIIPFVALGSILGCYFIRKNIKENDIIN
jgi:hypothetical protein